jgi:hypothetical protein
MSASLAYLALRQILQMLTQLARHGGAKDELVGPGYQVAASTVWKILNQARCGPGAPLSRTDLDAAAGDSGELVRGTLGGQRTL